MSEEVKTDQSVPQGPEPIKVKVSNGTEVLIQEDEMALLVVYSQRTGRPTMYEVQNCGSRAFARMLLNEALYTYGVSSQAHANALVLAEMFAKPDKKEGSIKTPFTK